MTAKIFINYRREDSRDMAARTRDRLASIFGEDKVFMDVDNLRAGQRFDRELEQALGRTDIFLAFIGPRWGDLLQARKEAAERDYVREELSSALKRGLVVIPVTVENAALPRSDSLPEDIRELIMHHKHAVTHENFGRDLTALVEAIKFARQQANPNAAPQQGRSRAGLMAAGAVLAAVLAGGAVTATWLGARTQMAAAPPAQPVALNSGALSRLVVLAAEANDAVATAEHARLLRLQAEQDRQRGEAARQAEVQAAREGEARNKAEADERRRAEAQSLAAAEAKRTADQVEAQRVAAARELASQAEREAQRKSDDEQRRAEDARKQTEAQRAANSVQIEPFDLAKMLQTELKRVGCYPAEVDGKWGGKATDALRKFSQHTKQSLVVSVPSLEALEAVAQQPNRICPLECDSDQRVVNGRCVDKPEPEAATRRTRREEPDDDPPRKQRVAPTPRATASSSGSSAPVRTLPNNSSGSSQPSGRNEDLPVVCSTDLRMVGHPFCQRKK
jgi:hypothetical protein